MWYGLKAAKACHVLAHGVVVLTTHGSVVGRCLFDFARVPGDPAVKNEVAHCSRTPRREASTSSLVEVALPPSLKGE